MKIAISGKGGVGKTTLAGTLARLFARDGYNVLAIDADPSMNLGSALGIKELPKPVTEHKDLVEERAGMPMGMFKMNPKVDDVVGMCGCTGPDNVKLVVHGHAHRGAHEGRTNKGVPVYNVALPVLRTLGDTPYRVFEI